MDTMCFGKRVSMDFLITFISFWRGDTSMSTHRIEMGERNVIHWGRIESDISSHLEKPRSNLRLDGRVHHWI